MVLISRKPRSFGKILRQSGFQQIQKVSLDLRLLEKFLASFGLDFTPSEKEK